MCDADRRRFLRLSMVALGAFGVAGTGLAADPAPAVKPKVYACPPCGCGQDDKELPAPGVCSVCGMPLVEKGAAAPSPAGGLAQAGPEAGHAGHSAHPGSKRLVAGAGMGAGSGFKV